MRTLESCDESCKVPSIIDTLLLPMLMAGTVFRLRVRAMKLFKATSLLFLISDVIGANVIHMKLAPPYSRGDLEGVYPDYEVKPLFSLSRERLQELSSVQPGLPDLTLWYSVTSPEDFEYQRSDIIREVVIPKTDPPPESRTHNYLRSLAITPDFVPGQGYLLRNLGTNTDNGIDAEYSWTFSGGSGEGVTIYDVEYGWNQEHEDLFVAKNVNLLLNAGEIAVNPWPDNWHGTAVLGEMISTPDNNIGVKGISFKAGIGMAPQNTNMGSNRGNAILLAVNDGKAGDVILLEMQTGVCFTGSYGPAEWDQAVFDTTQVATANGLVVVAAAGNGNVDLDASGCGNKFNRANRDSGAIIVGAGGSGLFCRGDSVPARNKMGYSSYGSILDVHGWGECVTTTGYGVLHKDTGDLGNENKWYTDEFSGTSSASPMVAAAVANLQGIAIKKFGGPLSPLLIRQLLRDTGLLQLGDTSQRIGPLVSLRAAIDSLLSVAPTPPPQIQTPPPTPFVPKPTPPPSTPPPSPPLTTRKPTRPPTEKPSKKPTKRPTRKPTRTPTPRPSDKPTKRPSHKPTRTPTPRPSYKPTNLPSYKPISIEPLLSKLKCDCDCVKKKKSMGKKNGRVKPKKRRRKKNMFYWNWRPPRWRPPSRWRPGRESSRSNTSWTNRSSKSKTWSSRSSPKSSKQQKSGKARRVLLRQRMEMRCRCKLICSDKQKRKKTTQRQRKKRAGLFKR